MELELYVGPRSGLAGPMSWQRTQFHFLALALWEEVSEYSVLLIWNHPGHKVATIYNNTYSTQAFQRHTNSPQSGIALLTDSVMVTPRYLNNEVIEQIY